MKTAGQSLIEFLLTMTFSLGLLFAFVQLAINAGTGYLAHYSTFQASRAYLVFDDNNIRTDASDQNAEAFVRQRVIPNTGLDTMGVDLAEVSQKISFNAPSDDNKKFEYVGAFMKFSKKFNSIPLVGGIVQTRLFSESFLGREPTRGTCLRRICEHVFNQHIQFNCNINNENEHITVFDNGC